MVGIARSLLIVLSLIFTLHLSAADPLKVEIVAEQTSIQPGHPFWVALHLSMDKDWHTYWKNPGDAGLPTGIAWNLPEGVTAGEPLWPYPKRFEINSLIGFGYEEEAWILVPFEVAPSVSVNTTAELSAKLTWLACDSSNCIPGESAVQLAVPVKGEAPQKITAYADHFAEAREKLPKHTWQAKAEYKDGLLDIHLQAPPNTPLTFEEADFFPNQLGLVDLTAEAVLVKEELPGSYRLLMRPEGPGKQLEGVAVLYAGEEAEAIELAIPVKFEGSKNGAVAQADSVVEKRFDNSLADPHTDFQGGFALAMLLTQHYISP